MQTLLKTLVQPGVCLTLDLLMTTTGRTYAETTRALREAFETGAVKRSEKGNCYQITTTGKKILTGAAPAPIAEPICPPVLYKDTRQQRIWNAMRVLKKFSCTDVTLCARREDEMVSDFTVSANQYMNLLRRAGFLIRLDHADKRGVRPIRRYRLAKDTGPYAPAARRDGKILDRNTGVETDVRRS